EDGTQCYCGNLSPDARMLVVGDGQGAHLFEWATGKKLRLLKGHQLQLWAVTFSPKGDVLASAANMDQNILLWEMATGMELRRIRTPHQHDLRCLAWSPNGKVLASAGAKGDNLGKMIDTICLWNPATGEQLAEWVAHRRREDDEKDAASVHSLVFSPD